MYCEGKHKKGKRMNRGKQGEHVKEVTADQNENFAVWGCAKETGTNLINLADFPALKCNTTSKSKSELKFYQPYNQNSKLLQGSEVLSESHVNLTENKYEANHSNSKTKELKDKVGKSRNSENGENFTIKENYCTAKINKEISGSINTKPVQPYRNPYKKKRVEPISFNLEEVLGVQNIRKRVKQRNGVKGKFQRSIPNETLSGNLLDSSNPKRNRGKHREIKKPKITSLKLLIIKERILKQKAKERGAIDTQNFQDVIDKLDKLEIEKYLNEVNKKKIEINKNKQQTKVALEKKIEDDKKKLNSEVETLEKSNSENVNEKSNVEKNKLKCEAVKSSSKMREYCSNVITASLNTAVSELIKGVIAFQDRAFLRDPIKARAKKRHVTGFKEVKKYMIMKKVKLLVIPPNLEKLHLKGSINDVVNELKTLAESQSVPCVFALDRYRLGRCTKKNVFVSAFAVLNYEGLESQFEDVLHHLEEAKKQYIEGLQTSEVETKNENLDNSCTQSLMSALQETLKTSNQNRE